MLEAQREIIDFGVAEIARLETVKGAAGDAHLAAADRRELLGRAGFGDAGRGVADRIEIGMPESGSSSVCR